MHHKANIFFKLIHNITKVHSHKYHQGGRCVLPPNTSLLFSPIYTYIHVYIYILYKSCHYNSLHKVTKLYIAFYIAILNKIKLWVGWGLNLLSRHTNFIYRIYFIAIACN